MHAEISAREIVVAAAQPIDVASFAFGRSPRSAVAHAQCCLRLSFGRPVVVGESGDGSADTLDEQLADEEDSIEIVRRVLERVGAEVRTALSMKEGLKEFVSFSPHVVITDIGMPDHDGYELLARLRELPEGRRVPAVALTAMARADDRIQTLRAGFQLHIAKPVDANELVAVVQNLAALRK